MKLSRTTIHTFRFLLFITLIVVTFLATSSLEFTIVPSTYDKLSHFVAFFVLALLMDFSFPGSSFNVIKVVFLVSYSFSLEIIQHLLPQRMFSLFDIVADIVGLAAYGMFIPVFKNIPLLNHRWAS